MLMTKDMYVVFSVMSDRSESSFSPGELFRTKHEANVDLNCSRTVHKGLNPLRLPEKGTTSSRLVVKGPRDMFIFGELAHSELAVGPARSSAQPRQSHPWSDGGVRMGVLEEWLRTGWRC